MDNFINNYGSAFPFAIQPVPERITTSDLSISIDKKRNKKLNKNVFPKIYKISISTLDHLDIFNVLFQIKSDNIISAFSLPTEIDTLYIEAKDDFIIHKLLDKYRIKSEVICISNIEFVSVFCDFNIYSRLLPTQIVNITDPTCKNVGQVISLSTTLKKAILRIWPKIDYNNAKTPFRMNRSIDPEPFDRERLEKELHYSLKTEFIEVNYHDQYSRETAYLWNNCHFIGPYQIVELPIEFLKVFYIPSKSEIDRFPERAEFSFNSSLKTSKIGSILGHKPPKDESPKIVESPKIPNSIFVGTNQNYGNSNGPSQNNELDSLVALFEKNKNFMNESKNSSTGNSTNPFTNSSNTKNSFTDTSSAKNSFTSSSNTRNSFTDTFSAKSEKDEKDQKQVNFLKKLNEMIPNEDIVIDLTNDEEDEEIEKNRKAAEERKRKDERKRKKEEEKKREEEERKKQQEEKNKNMLVQILRYQEDKRKKQEEEERKIMEEKERKRKAEEERKRNEEIERKRKEDEERKRKEELERKRKEDEERKRKEELERKRKEELERKIKEDEERKRREELERKRKEDEERKRKEEIERKRKEDEERKRKEELERKRKEELERKIKEDEERKRREELERKRKEDEERKRKEEIERKRKEDEERKRKEELERKRKEELERKIKEDEERKRREELERKRKEDEERKRKEEIERKRKEDEERKKLEEKEKKRKQAEDNLKKLHDSCMIEIENKKEEAIAELKRKTKEAEENLEKRKRELEEREKSIADKEKKVNDMQKITEEREKKIIEKENQIENKEKKLNEREFNSPKTFNDENDLRSLLLSKKEKKDKEIQDWQRQIKQDEEKKKEMEEQQRRKLCRELNQNLFYQPKNDDNPLKPKKRDKKCVDNFHNNPSEKSSSNIVRAESTSAVIPPNPIPHVQPSHPSVPIHQNHLPVPSVDQNHPPVTANQNHPIDFSRGDYVEGTVEKRKLMFQVIGVDNNGIAQLVSIKQNLYIPANELTKMRTKPVKAISVPNSDNGTRKLQIERSFDFSQPLLPQKYDFITLLENHKLYFVRGIDKEWIHLLGMDNIEIKIGIGTSYIIRDHSPETKDKNGNILRENSRIRSNYSQEVGAVKKIYENYIIIRYQTCYYAAISNECLATPVYR
ncbi:hypothetical protein TVAG_319400 [Trichomonas vaginalis G3]|uniref:Uncharacterized protein n=1 Tax=Trichomonas vaginalis (strain ATCC PRA-98 / G3) TaxID=412133 RepID=A2DQ88_TRIV3|nr:stress response protein NST1 family [Trichomonas vaginalis G3]EAY17345.1 hypothetical protein TVAG_319400 [Trichomonas vaginalis G3]KAI5491353.1 stress response protein NST1 family [Trichomonas vaginalis G3]|eukprot:XP_001330714.1 hypothetical protein [Trichomonas vaginalis G3]